MQLLRPRPRAAGIAVQTLVSDVSFTARPGTLTAIIGPSGAGKSTLIGLLGETTRPSVGRGCSIWGR